MRVVADFETFFDTATFTLKKLSTEAYIRDPQFQAMLLGVKVDGKQTACLFGDELSHVKELSNHEVIAHNARFDASILSYIYGVQPAEVYCTQAMARACGAARISGGESLSKLAEFFKVNSKGGFLGSMSGRRVSDLTTTELTEYMDYCKNDVDICHDIFQAMLPYMPDGALEFISLTTKMYSNPLLVVNRGLLQEYLVQLEAEAADDLERLAASFGFPDRDTLLVHVRSRDKFAALLRRLGVEPPLKVSSSRLPKYKAAKETLTARLADPHANSEQWRTEVQAAMVEVQKGVHTYAFAKDDEAFQAMLDGEDEEVATLCAMRVYGSSSIRQSRAKTLLEIAERGPLPVPLNAYNARTGRYTAGNPLEDSAKGDGLNLQNFPKRTGDKTLLRSIMAPVGHVLVGSDSSQIEARIGAWVSQQLDLHELFRQGKDIYCAQAPDIYNLPADEVERKAKVEKVPEFVAKRNVLKEYILASQYGMSGEKFALNLRKKKVWLGEPGDQAAHDEEAKRLNRMYRMRMGNIKGAWKYWSLALEAMCRARETSTPWSGCWGGPRGSLVSFNSHWDLFGHATPGIRLPNGFIIYYPELRWETDANQQIVLNAYGKPQIVYTQRKRTSEVAIHIHGAMAYSHIIQGLSFQILAWQGVQLSKAMREAGGQIVLNIHDAWYAVVPNNYADWAVAEFNKWMVTTPPWLPETLPLECETHKGANLAEV